MQKRIVTIQDISCFGKCSLTVALPLISAMGVETAVIPTAVLSTHTGGFTGYTFRDLTADIPQISAHWQNLKLHFDGIYTGYLGSRQQVQMVADFFDAFSDAKTQVIVDPVMGDRGRLYAGFTPDFAVEMRTLCQNADVIVPNMTEACLLLDMPYLSTYTETDVKEILRRLTDIGCSTVILTGVQYGDGRHGAVAYHCESDQFCSAFRQHIPKQMHGTGDIFSSVLSGALVQSAPLEKAVEVAVNFTADSIEATIDDLYTLPKKQAPWYGVAFESCIGNLVAYTKQFINL
ncbi:MAG: pyridoxamine kinase [Ruminococcus sp.]|nr:pyridoxamine kinase [Ruminococcus sp.]